MSCYKKSAVDRISPTPELIREARNAARNGCDAVKMHDCVFGYRSPAYGNAVMREYSSAAYCNTILGERLGKIMREEPSWRLGEEDAEYEFDGGAQNEEEPGPESLSARAEERLIEADISRLRGYTRTMKSGIMALEWGYYVLYSDDSINEFDYIFDYIGERLPFGEYCERPVSEGVTGIPAPQNIFALADELKLAYYDGSYTARRCRRVMASASGCFALSKVDRLLIAVLVDYFSDLAKKQNVYKSGSCSKEMYLKSTFIGLQARLARMKRLMKEICRFYSEFDGCGKYPNVPRIASMAQTVLPYGFIPSFEKEAIIRGA